MKVLILGKKGMLGSELVKFFPKSISFGREELDITDRTKVIKKIKELKPDIVINTAGFTEVDTAEIKKEEAYKTNVDGVKNILEACKLIKSTIVHISTDYVFDGKKKYYKEKDKKNPVNFYGKTKAESEDCIINSYDRYYIIRTAWLYGKNGKNFVSFILGQINRGGIQIIDDQFGSPTYTMDLAKKIKEVIEKEKYGIYHITNSGYCSWKQFAEEIVKIKNINLNIKGIKSNKIKRAAIRPKKSILLNTKVEKLRSWQSALKDFLR